MTDPNDTQNCETCNTLHDVAEMVTDDTCRWCATDTAKRLDYHNNWRRGAPIPMGDPAQLGQDLATAVRLIEFILK